MWDLVGLGGGTWLVGLTWDLWWDLVSEVGLGGTWGPKCGTWWDLVGLGGTFKFNSINFDAQRTPLDLSEERRPDDEDSDSDDAVDLSRGHQPAPLSSDGREDLKLKSWMLLWQQQQKEAERMADASAAAEPSSSASSASSTSSSAGEDVAVLNDYAEQTMRQLLSLYGLPRQATEQLSIASGQSKICMKFALNFRRFFFFFFWGGAYFEGNSR